MVDARVEQVPDAFFCLLRVFAQVGFEQGKQGQAAGIVQGGDAIADEAEVGVSHVHQMLHVELQAVAAGRCGLDVAIGDTVVHVEPSGEAVHIPLGEVQLFVDEAQVDAAPVGGVGDAGVEAGKSVLPPRHAGGVQKRNAGYERPGVSVAAIGLFEVAPLAEPSVAQAEYAFRHAQVVRVKFIFNNAPFISFQVSLHGIRFELWP